MPRKRLDKPGQFLSTPSVRRATAGGTGHHDEEGISIHALRAEGDGRYCDDEHNRNQFLSTPSVRRATTRAKPWAAMTGEISIHALRAEGDLTAATTT